ncbi:bifunctional diguanylate cyclase/phosphodiesterase [Cellulomonas sp. KRMCY2]|uniref:putative bifunctional diguanylate cyclase/phosphodiesterase n=1 Tax=Cellulomonas sp. KRMCY2 TaxID=1304865 RepID=UPI00045E5DC2|nr:EAL domain-containing protein [Cellulomonas sp. KRMCY2]
MSHDASPGAAPTDGSDHTLDEVWLRNLLDDSNEIIYFKDLQSRFILVSRGCAQLHDMTQEELLGLSDFDLFGDVHASAAYADEQRIIATGEPIVNKQEQETWDDRPDSWVASSKFPLRDRDGAIIGTFGISRDLTSRVLLEQEMVRMARASEKANAELSRVESQLRAVLNGSTDAIAQYDERLRYRYINPAGERLRGVPLADLVGRTDRESGMPDPAAEAWETALHRVLDTGEPGELEYSTTTPGGEEGWFHTTLSPEHAAGGAVIGVLTSTRDITANKAAERALAHQAMHDSVTGLANRYLLMDRLGQALVRMERSPGRVVLYFVDIDHFKSVNDTYGHDVGDRLLAELGRRLTDLARREDTVARLGGDEFVLLCERVGTDEHVREIADRVVRTLAEPFVDNGVRVQLSASVGAATADDPMTSSSDLLRNADSAMYRVKQHGRNHFHVYDPDSEPESDGRLQLEADLQNALANDELRLVYQPLLSLADQRVLGFEALLRWEHPSWGTLQPLEFLAIAERIGLMGSIGAWVLDTACGRLAAWSAERGAGSGPLSMAVNVSGGQLRADGFVGLVADALATHGIEAEHLRLEISERALMGDDPEVAAVLSALSRLGIQLAVDDFGATVNSLARLPTIPVSVVKLERFTDVTRQRGLVAAVIATAHGLGMSVVGGGIEDADQLAELVALACDDGQGFLLGRPLDDGAVERLLLVGGGFSAV